MDIRTVISDDSIDRAWDGFVASAPGGTHLQSTCSAEVKRTVGWRPVRILAFEGNDLVGGCQILLRRLSRFGTVAYVPRAPLASDGRADVAQKVTIAFMELAQSRRFLYSKLQPPEHGDGVADLLAQHGWTISNLTVSPEATVRVDTSAPDDELMASLNTSVRRNVRIALRQGVSVRMAGAEEIGVFGNLVEGTSSRQEFTPYSTDYYEQILRAFSAGHAWLLLAEHEGSALAGSLLVGYGNTVTCKMSAWSGEKSKLYPSTLIHWEGLRWTRDKGYRFYDFDGISRESAQRLLAGADPRTAGGVEQFKLGFGGDIVLLPSTYDRVDHPLGWAIQRVSSQVGRHKFAQALIGRRKR